MKFHVLFESAERSILSVMGEQPEHVSSNFSCTNINLTSLKGAPSSVGGHFYCSNNKLTSLEGAPSSVDGDFYCTNNKLTSLEGAPSSVGSDFYCYHNNLTSLHNIHKQIKHIGGFIDFEVNPIKSHVLGLLLIDGLRSIFLDNKKVQDITNKHLQGDRDVFACQEELIEAGFDEYAQL